MANYQLLKADIDEKVYQNGHQEITGENLNSVLNAMVTTLGAEYQFAGVATIDTNPGTPDAKVFYIANGKGTYTNFGGIEVTEDEVVVLYWDTAWHKEATGIASQEKLTELEGEVEFLALGNTNSVESNYIPVSGLTAGKKYKLVVRVKVDTTSCVIAMAKSQSVSSRIEPYIVNTALTSGVHSFDFIYNSQCKYISVHCNGYSFAEVESIAIGEP